MDAWACQTAGGALAPFQYEPAPLGEFDCEIRITHCGLCHSDVHVIHDDWGISRYPLVPGHEIVGLVTVAGARAGLAPGQRVGVGWLRGACLECEQCEATVRADAGRSPPVAQVLMSVPTLFAIEARAA